MADQQTVFYGVAYYDGSISGSVVELYRQKEDAEARVKVIEDEIEENPDESIGGVTVVELDITKAK